MPFRQAADEAGSYHVNMTSKAAPGVHYVHDCSVLHLIALCEGSGYKQREH
jgi:hypothetical protein